MHVVCISFDRTHESHGIVSVPWLAPQKSEDQIYQSQHFFFFYTSDVFLKIAISKNILVQKLFHRNRAVQQAACKGPAWGPWAPVAIFPAATRWRRAQRSMQSCSRGPDAVTTTYAAGELCATGRGWRGPLLLAVGTGGWMMLLRQPAQWRKTWGLPRTMQATHRHHTHSKVGQPYNRESAENKTKWPKHIFSINAW